MMVRKLAISGGLLALVIWLEMRKRPSSSSEGRIELFVECDPSSPNYDSAACRESASSEGFWDAVDENDAGFRNLIHLFDD